MLLTLTAEAQTLTATLRSPGPGRGLQVTLAGGGEGGRATPLEGVGPGPLPLSMGHPSFLPETGVLCATLQARAPERGWLGPRPQRPRRASPREAGCPAQRLRSLGVVQATCALAKQPAHLCVQLLLPGAPGHWVGCLSTVRQPRNAAPAEEGHAPLPARLPHPRLPRPGAPACGYPTPTSSPPTTRLFAAGA